MCLKESYNSRCLLPDTGEHLPNVSFIILYSKPNVVKGNSGFMKIIFLKKYNLLKVSVQNA